MKGKQPPPSDEPFGDALRRLMADRELTYRALAEATVRVDGQGIKHPYLNQVANDQDDVTERVMWLVAKACGISPNYFAEYRLVRARNMLDPKKVGLKRALKNLEQHWHSQQNGDGNQPSTRGSVGRAKSGA